MEQINELLDHSHINCRTAVFLTDLGEWTYFDSQHVSRVALTVFFYALQRIRELEDRIDLQKRQIKEIEEKVPRENICHLRLRKVKLEVKTIGGSLHYCNLRCSVLSD